MQSPGTMRPCREWFLVRLRNLMRYSQSRRGFSRWSTALQQPPRSRKRNSVDGGLFQRSRERPTRSYRAGDFAYCLGELDPPLALHHTLHTQDAVPTSSTVWWFGASIKVTSACCKLRSLLQVQLFSPYRLSSTYPACGYQMCTPLAIDTPLLAMLRYVVEAALDPGF